VKTDPRELEPGQIRQRTVPDRDDRDTLRCNRFEALFAELYEPVQRYVRRRVGADDVDDVVSNTMLTLWRRLNDVPVSAELPWAYGVARRNIANMRRAAGRRARLRERAVAEPIPAGDTPHHLDAELEIAMGALPTSDRDLLELWAWEQLGAGEIATVLGTTANAISIRLHRAKRRLAENLEKARKLEESPGHSPRVQSKEDWS
jgi:RNA polymerase sigma-70 factor (ECF subfamily)